MINQKNKILYFTFIIFSILLLSSFVSSDNSFWDHNFLDYFNSQPFWIEDLGSNPHETLGWYPVSDWEIGVCKEVFSTEFQNSDTDHSLPPSSFDERNYGLTIAINPVLKEQIYTDEEGDPVYLFSVSWYLQGLDEDVVEYKLKAIKREGGYDFLDLGGDENSKEFTLLTGTSGFYSAYSETCYSKITLLIDDNVQSTYDVICEDKNGDYDSSCSFCNS